jgi:hypothetical protein
MTLLVIGQSLPKRMPRSTRSQSTTNISELGLTWLCGSVT